MDRNSTLLEQGEVGFTNPDVLEQEDSVSLVGVGKADAISADQSLSIQGLHDNSFAIVEIKPVNDGVENGFIVAFSQPVERSSVSANDFIPSYYTDNGGTVIEGQIASLTWIDELHLKVIIEDGFPGYHYRIDLSQQAEIIGVDGEELFLKNTSSDALPLDEDLPHNVLFDTAHAGAGEDTVQMSVRSDFTLPSTIRGEENVVGGGEENILHDVVLHGEGTLHLNGDTDIDIVRKLAGSRLTAASEDTLWNIEVVQSPSGRGSFWDVREGDGGYTSLVYSDGTDSYAIEIDTSASAWSLNLIVT
jgi:hypothetical protein